MKEKERLQELYDYKILDTAPEKDLDELIEIAAAIFGTPMSLITFIDDKRQWFKAAIGIDGSETLRKDSFCHHALNMPDDVLVVHDPLGDDRFKDNRYVTGDPNIRFYAGAPLTTPKGNVLGTLCVIDDKPRRISQSQIKALKLLAKKAMDFLTARKLILDQEETIESNALQLKKLTDQVPGCIYQFEMTREGYFIFHFVSEGVRGLHPSLTPDKIKGKTAFVIDVIHPGDKQLVEQAIQNSFRNLTDISVAFRVPQPDGAQLWFWANARPERKENGSVMWYGVYIDVTNRIEYEEALQQISFDISHVLRGPVTTLLGLTQAIELHSLTKAQLKEYVGHIKTVSEEMDKFTRRLNEVYYEKKSLIRPYPGNQPG